MSEPPVSFRLRWYPRVLLGVLGMVVVVAAVAGSGAETLSGPLGGDFPSFYGAGSIVADGQGDRLYDADLQGAVQSEVTGDEEGFLYFAYPAFVAYPYAALSRLPYRVAWLIHVAVMGAFLWGSIHLARPLLPRLLRTGDHELAALAVSLAAYPILRAVLGGQNTTLTLFLLVAVWRLAADDSDLLAGLALAALLYKPQFGLPMLLLVILARRWRIVAWWAAGAAVLYAAGALVIGVGWVADWLEQVDAFDDLNVIFNGDLMVSAIGFFKNLLGVEAVAAYVIAGIVIAVVAMPTGRAWWRDGISAHPMALAAPALVIVAPSALYYDGGLLLVTVGVGLALSAPAAVGVSIAIVVASWSQLFADSLGWSPIFLLLLGGWGWAVVAREGERITPM